MNPKSNSSAGVSLSKNKVFITETTTTIGKPKMDIKSAEMYPLYSTNQISDEQVSEIGYLLLLLFFTIGQMG